MGKKAEFNIQARSTAAAVEGLEVLRVRARAAGVKSNGRKLSSEAMVNAIVLAFLDLPREKQIEALSAYVPIFENQASEAEEPDVAAHAPPTVVSKGKGRKLKEGG